MQIILAIVTVSGHVNFSKIQSFFPIIKLKSLQIANRKYFEIIPLSKHHQVNSLRS